MDYRLIPQIMRNPELLDLYQNDSIFRRSIDVSADMDKTPDEALLFALIQGYKAKKIIEDNAMEYMKSDCRPIMIDGVKWIPNNR